MTTDERLIEELIDRGTPRIVSEGDQLCRHGDLSSAAYVVISGELEASLGEGSQLVAIATHGPGALVGEVTAMVGGHRTATLTANLETEVRVIDPATLRSVFARYPEASKSLAVAALHRTDRSRVASLLIEEFGAANSEAIRAIAESVTWADVEPGDTLFYQGEEAESAYLVLSGRLAVVINSEAVAHVGRGTVVGEFGLVRGQRRTASLVAARRTRLARIAQADFARVVSSYPDIAIALLNRTIRQSGCETTNDHWSSRASFFAVTAPVSASEIVAPISEALQVFGSTANLTSSSVDALLGAEGASVVADGDLGEVRVAELLHQINVENDHVLMVGGCDEELWSRRAIGHSDQVVIVSSASPDAEEVEKIHRLLSWVQESTPRWLAVIHEPGTVIPSGTPELRTRFGVDEVHHLRAGSDRDLARVGRLAMGRGVALVLSGGGARGCAHLGAIKAMEELDIPIDRVCGASMGSVIAGALGQAVPAADRLDMTNSSLQGLLDYSVPIVALVKAERITAALEAQFGDQDIEDMWVPFSCVSTNLTTAEVVHHRSGSMLFCIRASTAIPGVLPPVPHNGELLVDGGVLDNLPVDLVHDDPSIGTIIAIDVTPPRGPSARSDFGMSVSRRAALLDMVSRSRNTLPRLKPVLMRTMLIGSNRDRDRTVSSGTVDLYLDLELRGINLLDFKVTKDAAALGYETSRDRLAQWWETYLPNLPNDEVVG